MSLHELHRPLGDTGLQVSPLGLGTVKLGRDQGVKYPGSFRIPDDAQALALLNQARELGINLLDTAPAYGISEQRLGPLLRGQRQHWVIVSKVGEEFSAGTSHFDFSPAHARFSLERSLRRLQTEHIELLLVHSDGQDVAILRDSGIYETLAQFKREGKIGAFGLSGKTVEGGLLALQQGDCAMVTYNLAEQSEKPVLEYAAQQGKAILIKKALASGHACQLAGQAISKDACLTEGIDPVQASFELIFRQPAVSSAIIGTINPQHLAHNAAIAAAVIRRQG